MHKEPGQGRSRVPPSERPCGRPGCGRARRRRPFLSRVPRGPRLRARGAAGRRIAQPAGSCPAPERARSAARMATRAAAATGLSRRPVATPTQAIAAPPRRHPATAASRFTTSSTFGQKRTIHVRPRRKFRPSPDDQSDDRSDKTHSSSDTQHPVDSRHLYLSPADPPPFPPATAMVRKGSSMAFAGKRNDVTPGTRASTDASPPTHLARTRGLWQPRPRRTHRVRRSMRPAPTSARPASGVRRRGSGSRGIPS